MHMAQTWNSPTFVLSVIIEQLQAIMPAYGKFLSTFSICNTEEFTLTMRKRELEREVELLYIVYVVQEGLA